MKSGNKLLMIIISSLLLLVGGCSAAKVNKVYEEMIQKGLEKIEKDDLIQAKIYFEKALEQKPDSDQANILLNQTVHMQEAENEFKQNELKAANDLLDKVINAGEGTDILVQKATALKEEIQEIFLLEEDYLARYDKAKELLDDEAYDDSLQTIDEALVLASHPYYLHILKELENLKNEVKTAKEEAIALAAEKRRKEQAELEREAEEKRQEEERKAAELKEEEERKTVEKKSTEVKEAEKELAKEIGILGGYWLKDTMACHFTSEYVACALAESDFITYDEIFDIKYLSETKVEVTYEEAIVTYNLLDKNRLKLGDGEIYERVSEEEANAIYHGYYELP